MGLYSSLMEPVQETVVQETVAQAQVKKATMPLDLPMCMDVEVKSQL